ncbi:hypothetical protein [Streptosporangium sandarakinum]|uniref:hypothetical protein n=1 Tax=Streptosporangium sandarakinum TaxID=1260955 RepID=UPI0036CBAAC8
MVPAQVPAWAERLSAERQKRLWSQRDLAGHMVQAAPEHARAQFPKRDSIVRRIKDYERGAHKPDEPYRTLYCRVFGLSEEELFAETSTPSFVPELAGGFADAINLLREQWHLLVKRDNLLGPRHTLRGVHEQITLLEGFLESVRGSDRRAVLRLAAQYAESAAWLHEDTGELKEACQWTDQAMNWAYEAGDGLMVTWTMFRRSQQETAQRRPEEVIRLVLSSLRDADRLPAPMRAALLQQHAHGQALNGEERICQQLLDEAHTWAAVTDDGDARAGHGSFCTGAYLEIQRACCWMELGQAARAVSGYEAAMQHLSPVYQRDRGMTLAGLARAYAAIGEPEQAAAVGVDALKIARNSGSTRILTVVTSVDHSLQRYRRLPAVAELHDALTTAAC